MKLEDKLLDRVDVLSEKLNGLGTHAWDSLIKMDNKSYSVYKVIHENNIKIGNLKGYPNKETSNFNKRTVLSLNEEHKED